MTGPATATYAPAKRTVAAARRARARDRRVYLASHPIIFALLAATRGRSITRLGSTVLVQGTGAFREVLTRLPLDRTAEQTTGGLAREFIPDGGCCSIRKARLIAIPAGPWLPISARLASTGCVQSGGPCSPGGSLRSPTAKALT